MSDGTTHWNGTAHYAGCIQSGKEHYECALQEVGRLRGTIMDLRVKLEAADNRNTAMMKMGDRLIAEREVAAKTEYERGFDDGFILRKEKDGNGQSEYICTCGIRVTPHRCPTNNGF